MDTSVDTAAYLDGLSTLAQLGFCSIQEATKAVLQLMSEQLFMRSSFLTQVTTASDQSRVLAAFNEPGGCDIKEGTISPLPEMLQRMQYDTKNPSLLLLEDLRNEQRFSAAPDTFASPQIGCYIGVPVILSDGTFFGSLSTADPEPRKLSPVHAKLLLILARLLALQIERDQEQGARMRTETELTRALTSFQKVNEQREYLNKMQKDFVSIVNHEFRTTLTGIQGFSELMRDEEFSYQEIKNFAADINADARRLSHLINQLLDLDQMKSGQTTLHLEMVDLNAILMEMIERIRPTTTRHQLHIKHDTALPPLAGDRERLVQVVSNLINNAVKYSPTGGDIVLSTRIEGEFVRVCIQDQGVGIPPGSLEQVFDPYYSRTETEAGRYVKGTGLGLAIVRQIIKMHGGNTWAESAAGQGSIFHFTIPLTSRNTSMEKNNG